MENKKIFFIITPAHGHTNPPIVLANELVKRKAKVIFYSFHLFKERIENAGVEFRSYPVPQQNEDTRPPRISNDTFTDIIHVLLDLSKASFTYFLNEITQEKPDLIIYDVFCLPGKYLANHLRDNKIPGLDKTPEIIFMSSTFACKPGAFTFTDSIPVNQELINSYPLLKQKQDEVNKLYNINIEDPVAACTEMREKINLIATFKEFQPNAELFDESFKFIGCCISPVRYQQIKDPKLKSFIDVFNPINPVNSIEDSPIKINENNLKLVFVSLGTVFDDVAVIFEQIIDAIKEYNEEQSPYKSEVDLKELRIIFSLGKAFQYFENKIKNENLSIPDNFLLLPYAPQIEILQRASLFITHCGMNSSSEAIRYGVPVICIPLDADQPSVAKRLADELKLGVRLDKDNINKNNVRRAIHEIFKNDIYLNNMIEFSKISAKYNGAESGADVVEGLLNKL